MCRSYAYRRIVLRTVLLFTQESSVQLSTPSPDGGEEYICPCCQFKGVLLLLTQFTPGDTTETPRVYPPFQTFPLFHKGARTPSLYRDPRSAPERLWSNHFPRLLVFNTQCIIKQIPHPDRKKIEQLIRLELSQFIAKLKRVPTMDKSRRGRKSMTGRTGVSPRFSRSARRWESVAGSCLIYTWFFLSFLHICSAISWNNGHYLGWKVNVTMWGVIHHHLLSSAKALSSPALWAA